MAITTAHVTPYILSLFESACLKLFQRMHCTVHRLGSSGAPQTWPAALVEASSSELRVTLLLRMPDGLLNETMPMNLGMKNIRREDQIDWLSELANQALGRLKNKLLNHGCTLSMGLPKPCDERQLSEFEFRPGEKHMMHFAVNKHIVECALSINKRNPRVCLSDFEDEDMNWFDESELQNL